MLNVIEYGKDEYDFPALLVLGCFDAIHVGHRDLIKKAKLQAKINGLDLGVMLFRNGKGGKTVYSFEERLSILEEFNVKFVLVIDYTQEFQNTSPEDFLHAVEDKVNVKAYMSGKDFRFGAKAKGKSSTLKNYAEDEENGVWYMPVKDVMIGEEKISTTQIKEHLENGDIKAANELLGSEFFVRGEVVKGAGRGASQLGYPTVNIVYPESKSPLKQGVYKVKSKIGDTVYFGIANYGNCPTFGDERIALEVNFEGFDGELYGETLNIGFLDYVRDIAAFASPEELAAQLKADKALLAADIAAYKEEEAAKAAAVAEHAEQHNAPHSAEAVVVKEPAQPAEDIEITPEEYKSLDSGFGDIVEAPVEETVQPEESAVAEPVAEKTVAEEVPQPAEAPAPVEEAVKPEETESVTEIAEEIKEEPTQPVETVVEEAVAESKEATEETAEEEQPVAEAEQPAEAVEEQAEEEIEVVGDGFDDVVEEPIEETVVEEAVTEEAPQTAEAPAPVEEVAESEEATEEQAEAQTEEVAEVTEEENKSEEDNGEDKVD